MATWTPTSPRGVCARVCKDTDWPQMCVCACVQGRSLAPEVHVCKDAERPQRCVCMCAQNSTHHACVWEDVIQDRAWWDVCGVQGHVP